ncbi:MAG TPA: hypothetical protein VH475_03400 [Tepidisphaeraceae bacterium]|jgi:hypothetical protein
MLVATRIVPLFLLLGVFACSTPTRLESSRPSAAANGKSYRRPLICAVARRPDVRGQVEAAFKAELNARGIDAVPSADYLPETRQADRATFEKVVQNSKSDAILITRLAKVERRNDVTGAAPPAPAPPKPSEPGYFGYYAWAWGGVYDPPQVYAVDAVLLETLLIDPNSSEVIWTGATRVLDPTKIKEDARDLARVVVAELIQKGLVPGVAR